MRVVTRNRVKVLIGATEAQVQATHTAVVTRVTGGACWYSEVTSRGVAEETLALGGFGRLQGGNKGIQREARVLVLHNPGWTGAGKEERGIRRWVGLGGGRPQAVRQWCSGRT